MYFTKGKQRAFELLMQQKPGFDRYQSGCAGDDEDCGQIPDVYKRQLLVFTGGLGPTADDLTKETVAACFGDTLTLSLIHI